jgi:dipeptidyl aminopeptidase/acylaminoacyl peptidase
MISSQRVSPDGQWVGYGLFPQQGDGEVILRHVATGVEIREPAGERPQPQPREEGEEGPPQQRGVTIAFTADSKTAVFSTFPSKAEAEKAKRARREAPKGGMVMVTLATKAVSRVANVKSFQVPADAAGPIAYLKEAPPAATGEQKKSETPARRGPRKEYGTQLVLRAADGGERTFEDVTEYSLTKDAGALVYAVSSRTEEKNGLYAFVGGAEPATLLSGKGKYAKLTWDDNQKQLAFLSDKDDAAAKQPRHKLYLWDRGGAAREIVSALTAGFPKDFVISERGAIDFSRDGGKLFFGVARPAKPEEEKKDDTVAPEKPVYDLWHWKDDNVQPMQKARAAMERNRSYRAVFHVAEKKFVQLAEAAMPDVAVPPQGRFVIGLDDRAYRPMVEYDRRYSDAYLIDTANGTRRPLTQKATGQWSWSPDGAYALRFDGKDWHVLASATGAVGNLTANLNEKFYNEERDIPDLPNAYGIAGFTKDGKAALLYDRFDIWKVPLDGGAAQNLTQGAGRAANVQLRLVRLDPEEREEGIDLAKPLLLRGSHVETFETGLYRLTAGKAPVRLVWGAKNFSAPVKAKKADVYLLSRQSFSEYPDLHVTDGTFKVLKKVSDGGAQLNAYTWGTSEILQFRNTHGVPLKAVLYKPANFDPKKKYPMMVYLYEKLSQTVFNFVEPRPGTSINFAHYVSNGYVVLLPDVVYTVGYPGQSALNCILPAVDEVVEQGFIDEKAIGIQGHSWGGYQIAYMLTRTNRFRAASAGAPVANMISAYDGIRWGSGLPRQFQYERQQSRIGGSLWQYPLRFIENSPIFTADRVETPLLMLHNDNDDAVPWYQGIEYFLALRRLGKEVYLFNYNGEPHGLRKRVNQKDYTVRLQQFFDHYLKGAAKPEWMEKGRPFLDKEPAAATAGAGRPSDQ